MDLEEKINLVKRSPTEELIQEEELTHLFQTNNAPKHYLGIELSGILHLGSLLITGFKINDFIKAGIKTSVLNLPTNPLYPKLPFHVINLVIKSSCCLTVLKLVL